MTAPDYQSLIDGPTWDFIRETESWYPPETASYSAPQQREVYDRMCAAFRKPRPLGVQVTDRDLGGVPCRIYESAGNTLTCLYFHGGGFVVGGLDSHDDVCAEISAASGYRLVSVDYRLAPEHPHPAAFQDACAATLAAADEWYGALMLCGDSAGGALAAAVAHALGKQLPFVGQLLIYPGLGGDRSRGSYITHAEAPMLTTADVAAYGRLRHGGAEPDHDPSASPLQASDFGNLPATVVIVAECDPLADDGADYVGRILAAGGRALSITEPGLVHGYLRARHSVPRAADSFARICRYLKEMGG
ncbi:MAG TPA: esterase [Gemmobacter sp.]|nr:MAG: esterase [Rhodobacteraceae bacterium GWF1_65_7]HBD89614.1 esterase [Gemmobacter sp.]